LNNLFLYFHTLRYLKPQQIFYRIWFRFTKPRLDNRPAPAIRNKYKDFYPPARRVPSLIDEDTLHLLNQSGVISTIGWLDIAKSSSHSKLWRYNQHYFDDLNALKPASRNHWHLALLERWVVESKPGIGVGWDPYPMSLRIVNWVKWSYADNLLPAKCVQSLALQARFLMKRIEWHILGNHLFANAKALIFVGLFFSSNEADQWLRKGLKIVCNELNKQVLADGGNFERSPMYHAIFLEDLLDLLNLAQAFPGTIPDVAVKLWRNLAHKMLDWLNGMKHPDGEISFFNDASIGIASCPAELNAYANKLGLWTEPIQVRTKHFADSGYIRLSSINALVLLDVAPVGPDYLPGHAHADTLSFELSLFRQRVFVNCGTSKYGTDEGRERERSTAAHNTVEVDSKNSSEVWSGFRVARRAYPRDLVINDTSNSISISCSHDGYCRLPGKPIHQRTWEFSDSSLIVFDKINGDFKHAIAYFHLHPSINVSTNSIDSYQLQLPQGQKVTVNVEVGNTQLIQSHYAPEFGKRLKTKCIKVELATEGSRITIDWSSDD